MRNTAQRHVTSNFCCLLCMGVEIISAWQLSGPPNKYSQNAVLMTLPPRIDSLRVQGLLPRRSSSTLRRALLRLFTLLHVGFAEGVQDAVPLFEALGRHSQSVGVLEL